jgi:hypothetical protein
MKGRTTRSWKEKKQHISFVNKNYGRFFLSFFLALGFGLAEGAEDRVVDPNIGVVVLAPKPVLVVPPNAVGAKEEPVPKPVEVVEGAEKREEPEDGPKVEVPRPPKEGVVPNPVEEVVDGIGVNEVEEKEGNPVVVGGLEASKEGTA